MKETNEKSHQNCEDEAECNEEEEEREMFFTRHEGNEKKCVHCLDIDHSISQEIETTADSEMKLRKKKALLEFRCKVEDAILDKFILEKPISGDEIEKKREELREITLWGIPLLPSKGHEGTDTVLLKFLKAKEFKVQEAFDMLRKTLTWRKEYKTDAILEEKLHLDLDLENVLFMNGVDKQGHPLDFAIYGAFKDKGLYRRVLGTEADRENFLRWRVQYMEKIMKKLTFKAGGADSILQITDFKNSPGPEMKELRSVVRKVFCLLSANYPEIIHKNILINVPFWYYTSHLVASKFMSPRLKSKFIVARGSKVTRTLLKYISAENLPVEYGGLRRENDVEFSSEDNASELIVRANSSACIRIPVSEAGVTIAWDFTVVGWEVTCKEEFIPDDEGSYRVLLRKYKEKRMGESIRNSFYIYEPGKLVITIDNTSLKKRRVYYRSKTKPYVTTYILNNK